MFNTQFQADIYAYTLTFKNLFPPPIKCVTYVILKPDYEEMNNFSNQNLIFP